MSAKRRTFVGRRAPGQRRPARLRSSHGAARCWQDIGSELAVVLGIAPWGKQCFERYAAPPEDAKNPTSFRALAPATGMTVVGAARGLYVVQNELNRVAIVRPSPDLRSGTIVDRPTHAALDVPATIAEHGNRLYTVNARLGIPEPETARYAVVQLRP